MFKLHAGLLIIVALFAMATVGTLILVVIADVSYLVLPNERPGRAPEELRRRNVVRRPALIPILIRLDTPACPPDYPGLTYLLRFPNEAYDRHVSMLSRYDAEK